MAKMLPGTMKKSVIKILWCVAICIVLIGIFSIIAGVLFSVTMLEANDEALGTKLGLPVLIVSVIISMKIVKTGVLPGTKKEEMS